MNIADWLTQYGDLKLTEYRVPVSSWLVEIPFFEWCRMQGENNLFCSTEEVFDWARDNQVVVSNYVDAVGYPSKFDLYEFLDEARSWHIQTLLLDEYQIFAKYATLKYLQSIFQNIGVTTIDEFNLKKLLDLVYRERSSVCLEDIKECVERAVQDGLI